MQNPWQINDAFAPMFNEAISISSSGNRQTLNVAIFDDSTAEPYTSDMAASEIEHILVVC